MKVLFDLSFSGCCWIALSHYGGSTSWRVETTINLSPRSDNGKINSSPVTRSPAIVRFPGGCRQSFRIPVEDPDGDTVKCRFATISESLRDNTSFPYGTLDEVIDNESDFRLKKINQKVKKPVSEGFWLKPLTELSERQPYRKSDLFS